MKPIDEAKAFIRKHEEEVARLNDKIRRKKVGYMVIAPCELFWAHKFWLTRREAWKALTDNIGVTRSYLIKHKWRVVEFKLPELNVNYVPEFTKL